MKNPITAIKNRIAEHKRKKLIKIAHKIGIDVLLGMLIGEALIEKVLKGITDKPKVDVSSLTLKDNAVNFVCNQCDHLGTNICIGCTAPYE